MDLKFCGWNRYSTRFVFAPHFEWNRIADVDYYMVRLADRTKVLVEHVLKEPYWDLHDVWNKLPCDSFELLIQAFDSSGNETASALHKQFRKSYGYDGKQQEPLDWEHALQHNIAYLLEPAQDEIEEYEKGFPRFCWSSVEDSISRKRNHLAYPALHHPSFIFAFLNYVKTFPSARNAPEARKQAKQYGDWLLEYRHPEDYTCSLFPFSTIENGKFEGGCEGNAITLFRAARVGEAMLELYQAFSEKKYLDYAYHLSRTFARLQNDDGSWPYRVEPKTGCVIEEYTSNAITPARFIESLGRIVATKEFDEVVSKAVTWMLDNPVRTHLWQGMYEDIPNRPLFSNLQNWDVNEMIRYLAFYVPEKMEYINTAKRLNQFIEDQFVLWTEEEGFVKCPTPTVLEQYVCYHPMEVHTGNWLFSLLALHAVTHDESFLDRAVAAGNAIVRGQYRNGAFSTWGNDKRFGRPLNVKDWPGCNAVASNALMLLVRYHRSIKEQNKFILHEQKI